MLYIKKPIAKFPVYEVKTYGFSGKKGHIFVSEFNGESGEFYGFLIPAKSNLTLKHLPIEIWINDIFELKKLELEAVIANHLMINNEPSDAWVKTNPMSYAQIEANFNPTAIIGLRSMPNLDQASVSIVEKERFTVLVPLHGD